jgi:hypothetical protein
MRIKNWKKNFSSLIIEQGLEMCYYGPLLSLFTFLYINKKLSDKLMGKVLQ